MKKLFMILAVLATVFLLVSCGGSGKETPGSADGDTETDEDSADTASDTGDTEPDDDSGDTEPTDTGDTEPDGDTGEPEPDDDSEIPQPDGDTEDTEPDGDSGEPEPDSDSGDTEPAPASGTIEWNGDTASVTATEGELRTYTLATTAELRDNTPASKSRTFAETSGRMRLRSGVTMLDALFALALEEASQDSVTSITDGSFNHGNPIDCDCFETGENWHYVWTRDTAYAVDLGLAAVDPLRSRNSLNFKISAKKQAAGGGNTQIVQDTGSGGSWPVSTDRVIWALGAEEVLKNLSGSDYSEFLATAYEAIKNTVEFDRAMIFDPSDGIYTGETSFLDWREQTYPTWTAADTRHIGMSKSLSTNVAHLIAIESAAKFATELGRSSEAEKFNGWADGLRTSIRAKFYNAEAKKFSSFTTTFLDASPVEKRDLLGESLAILAGIVSQEEALEITKSYPVTAAGPSVVFPQEPATRIYHNRAIWPFVTAYALRSAVRSGNDKFYENAFMSLVRGAALNLSNMENLEFTTLSADYHDSMFPELSGPAVNSRRQLWSVGGFVSLVLDSLFGKEQSLHGIWFSPRIPVSVRNGFLAASGKLELRDLTYKGKKLKITINLPACDDRTDGFYKLKTLTLNGSARTTEFTGSDLTEELNTVEIELEYDGSTGAIDLRDCNVGDSCYAPLPVAIPLDPYGVVLDGGKLKVSFSLSTTQNVTYSIYRDGKKVATGVSGSPWIDTNSEDYPTNSHCYSVAPVNSFGLEAQHSDPICYWGEGFVRTSLAFGANDFDQTPGASDHNRTHFADWGRPDETLTVSNIAPTSSGTYLLEIEYGSGRPVDTGITACTKLVDIEDQNGTKVAENRMIVMPHLGAGDWERWGKSSFVSFDLEAGKTYRLTIKDNLNMSYFEHFKSYNGTDVGGGDDVYNRVNLSTVTFLQTKINN